MHWRGTGDRPDRPFEFADPHEHVMTSATRILVAFTKLHERNFMDLRASMEVQLLDKESSVIYTAIGRP